jgi:choline dehydrogenase-like flavoprotein
MSANGIDVDLLVVGSGPAGIAAAREAVRAGRSVTVVDGGVDLEPEHRQRLERMKRADRPDPDDVAVARNAVSATRSGVSLKRVHGSDFPYRGAGQVETSNVSAYRSGAHGGLGNVWGAAVLPFTERDTSDWDVPRTELDAAMRRVFDYLPLSGAIDDLVDRFPVHARSIGSMPAHEQTQRLLDRLGRRRDELAGRGVIAGRARLAVRAPDCIGCGQCLFGCPKDAIFTPQHVTADLARRPGWVVRHVVDRPGWVDVHLDQRRSAPDAPTVVRAERVFLAAGTIETTRILLRSSGRPTLQMRDSQYFLLPLLDTYGGSPRDDDPHHTLAQVFIEIDDARLSSYSVHLQVYAHNPLYAEAVTSMLGPVARVFRRPIDELTSRLRVVQGYLHSHESTVATASLHGETLHLRQHDPSATRRRVRRVGRRLVGLAPATGMAPVLPALSIGDFGAGMHIGAVVPVRARPVQDHHADLLGRPFGWSRIHVVDASSLPSIPATTITLNAMANASRIVDMVCREVRSESCASS